MSRLTDDDLHLFNEGTHVRLHHKLGAHVVPDGVAFAVWAPNARAVAVIGDWDGWGPGLPLVRRAASGIWEGVVATAHAGHRYKYRVVGADGGVVDKADPFAAAAELPPATASVVWAQRHQWADAAWMAGRGAAARLDRPWSIYEVHLGSWMRADGRTGAPLGYRELGHRLAAHAGGLGFTHVELLPLLEHPFYGSWGYQVTGYFAPTARYGSPDDLMAMIDTLHQAGLGVILDWVPAHFPTDAHGLGSFDGTHLFEHADPRRGFHPDWTSYIYNYGRHEVRAFLVSSAIAWLERFHVDALRVDGVASMLYRDYSRKAGEWVPDVDGSNHDRDAIGFLRQLTTSVAAAYPDVQTIAEESTAWPGVTHPVDAGGLGFGLKWDLGWMHDTLAYLAEDPIHRQWHHDKLTFRSVYADHERFVLPLSHDEVVHGKRALVAKLPGDPWQQLANLRLLFGYQWALPGKKLVFMGGELAAPREWNHDDVLDWDHAALPGPAGVTAWVRDLNACYRALPALHRRDCAPGGLLWLDADDRARSTLAFLRIGEPGDAPVLVACNFTPVVRYAVAVGVPQPGRWRELLSSDAPQYGGSGVGNLGGVDAVATPHQGQPASLALTLPPLGCVYLTPEVPA
ncbi:MAG: 1,4-alpha-glucan branching protein GlgB [Kofleriaceae bacterium]